MGRASPGSLHKSQPVARNMCACNEALCGHLTITLALQEVKKPAKGGSSRPPLGQLSKRSYDKFYDLPQSMLPSSSSVSLDSLGESSASGASALSFPSGALHTVHHLMTGATHQARLSTGECVRRHTGASDDMLPSGTGCVSFLGTVRRNPLFQIMLCSRGCQGQGKRKNMNDGIVRVRECASTTALTFRAKSVTAFEWEEKVPRYIQTFRKMRVRQH